MIRKIIITILWLASSDFTGLHASIKPAEDEKYKEKIALYFNYLNKGIHKNKLNNKVIKYLKTLGPEFDNEVNIISLQQKIHRKPFNLKNCLVDQSQFDSRVSQFQLLKVLRFCHSKIVKDKNEDELTPSEVSFIKKYYFSLVDTGNLGLVNLKRKKNVFPSLLAEVISLKKFDIDEITEVFQKTYAGKHIHYGEELTSHLQRTGIFPAKESKLFKKEFRLLCSKVLNNESPHQWASILEQTLSFYHENKKLIGYSYSNKKFRQVTRYLNRKGHKNVARRFIGRAIETQEQKHRADLYFERLFLDLKNEDYKSAYKYILKSGLLGKEKEFNSKLRFWVGKIYQKNNEPSLAEFLFKNQITSDPMNYYSILSSAYLIKLGKRKYVEKYYMYNSDYPLSVFNPVATKKPKFSRLRLWLNTEQSRLAHLEIEEILSTQEDLNERTIASTNIDTSFQVLKLFKDEEEYLKSFKFFNKNSFISDVEFLPTFSKILFPTPFEDKIRKHSGGVDPVLIFSLIRQESAFDPRAKSRVGARGLMQLMPSTARMYKKRLRKSQLYNPDLNLKLGTKYLNYLLNKYDHSLVYTLASYNAGETNLRRWRGKYITSSNDLINVESIPFSETQGYIKYISRNMFFYRLVFGEPIFKGLSWITSSI